jgi:magnesium transporter
MTTDDSRRPTLSRLPAAALARLRRGAAASARKRGAPPGTLIYTGPETDEPVGLSYLTYDSDGIAEKGRKGPGASLDECLSELSRAGTSWVNVDGLHDVPLIKQLGGSVALHRLVMEDIISTSQRAKIEEFPGHLYLVLRMVRWDDEADGILDEQVSLVVGDTWVLSFQERRGDVLEGVRQRIRDGRGLIRSRGAGYLAYALVDTVVDHYFGVIEKVSDRIEVLEDEVLANPDPQIVERIHLLKREMLLLRRAIWPLREVVSQLTRDPLPFITDETRVFLRDVYDHTVQVIDTVETLRDLLGGLTDLYMSGVSNRMNEVMKVLTMIATIFIPLSFLAGLYGMNFEVMPELGFPWAYPALLGLMALTAGGMVVYFHRKGWL